MQITSDSFGGRNVVFDYILEDLPGGVSLDKTRLKTGTTEIEAGTPVNVVKSTRVAEIVKSSTVITGSGAAAVRVATDHQWIAGEYVTDGLVCQTISSITAGATYDTLNLGGSLIKYAANDIIYEPATTYVKKGVVARVEGVSGHYLDIYDPTGGLEGMKVVLARAGGDTLAVTFATGTITISLANTTAGKNTAALISAGIQALDDAGWDFSSVYCVGTSWSEDGATITTASDYFEKTYNDKYPVTGFVKETVNVEEDNADVAVVIRGAVREGSLPFPLHADQKKQITGINFNV